MMCNSMDCFGVAVSFLGRSRSPPGFISLKAGRRALLLEAYVGVVSVYWTLVVGICYRMRSVVMPIRLVGKKILHCKYSIQGNFVIFQSCLF